MRGVIINKVFFFLSVLLVWSANAIVGGEYTAADSQKSVVGINLYFGSTSHSCTATVVGPRSLLTADHCVYSGLTKVEKDKLLKNESTIQLFQYYSGQEKASVKNLTVKRVQSANDRPTEELTAFDLSFDQADFAVLTLSEDISKSYEISELANALNEKDIIKVVGYGNQYPGEKPKEGVAYGPSGVLKFFEEEMSNVTFPRIYSNYLPNKKGTVAPGDSGGPVFVKDADGVYRIAAVVSKYSSPAAGENEESYGSRYSRVDSYSRFGSLARELIRRSEEEVVMPAQLAAM